MFRKSSSDLNELLKLLRRIIVLAIAAYGLAREMPYETLAVRLVLLWAVLYVSSGLVDVVFRKLSYQAGVLQDVNVAPDSGPGTAVVKSKEN